MLRAQERDEVRFDRLIIELYDITGDDRYMAEWTEKDPLFNRFFMEIMKLHRIHGVPIQRAINFAYLAHCDFDKEILDDNEKYAEEIKRSLFGPKPEDEPRVEPKKRRGIFDFLRRNRD